MPPLLPPPSPLLLPQILTPLVPPPRPPLLPPLLPRILPPLIPTLQPPLLLPLLPSPARPPMASFATGTDASRSRCRWSSAFLCWLRSAWSCLDRGGVGRSIVPSRLSSTHRRSSARPSTQPSGCTRHTPWAAAVLRGGRAAVRTASGADRPLWLEANAGGHALLRVCALHTPHTPPPHTPPPPPLRLAPPPLAPDSSAVSAAPLHLI
mmetsp:Transcript_22560/g.43842  ORF Transcript_22560/g.43842 Transcript_22560/m.43842 type:complete len:208 (+) Transcript_22560:264-887(+)